MVVCSRCLILFKLWSSLIHIHMIWSLTFPTWWNYEYWYVITRSFWLQYHQICVASVILKTIMGLTIPRDRIFQMYPKGINWHFWDGPAWNLLTYWTAFRGWQSSKPWNCNFPLNEKVVGEVDQHYAHDCFGRASNIWLQTIAEVPWFEWLETFELLPDLGLYENVFD